jgi:hypothetical protein
MTHLSFGRESVSPPPSPPGRADPPPPCGFALGEEHACHPWLIPPSAHAAWRLEEPRLALFLPWSVGKGGGGHSG